MAAQASTASEPPLEKLLALYRYSVADPDKETCHLAASLPHTALHTGFLPEEGDEELSGDDPSVSSNASDLLPQGSEKDTLDDDTDEESDDDSVPSNEEHKAIMVGSIYQAKIPSICPYTYAEKDFSCEDQLLWTPGILPVKEVEDFLLKTQKQHGQEDTYTPGDFVRDNEQALYELVKCKFNAEEALRRLRFNVKVISDEFCGWSEEECRNFEHGYRAYGKNFHLIQANKVRTRSVGECVHYYYMWKKSDRHEYFTQQPTRLSRKKYSLQTMEDGDEGETRNSDLSDSSVGSGQLKSLEPPQSNRDRDKHDGDLTIGLSELCSDTDNGAQRRFATPDFVPSLDIPQGRLSESCSFSHVPQQLQRPSPSFQWRSGDSPSCQGNPTCTCFYQLHMHGSFLCNRPDQNGAFEVEFSPETSPLVPPGLCQPEHEYRPPPLYHTEKTHHVCGSSQHVKGMVLEARTT